MVQEGMRKVTALYNGESVTEGAGVLLRRIFGYFEVPDFDPFLMLDDFRSETPEKYLRGFPWHPHRGIETITYVLRGEVEHGDSMGNKGVISSGDVQWMTAGSGVIHQEMPKGDPAGVMYGFQLWANLPAAQKMRPPRYRSVSDADIPLVARPDGVVVRVIAGTVDGATGPVSDVVIEPEYLDCTVPPGAVFTHPTVPGHTVFLYAIGGEGVVDGKRLRDGTCALFGDGSMVAVQADDTRESGAPFRFLLISGAPLGEPVAWRGPIVMNTQQELDAAYRELDEGTFIR